MPCSGSPAAVSGASWRADQRCHIGTCCFAAAHARDRLAVLETRGVADDKLLAAARTLKIGLHLDAARQIGIDAEPARCGEAATPAGP